MSDLEILEPGQSVDYVWDDLASERRLVVQVVGEIHVAKSDLLIGNWKGSSHIVKHGTGKNVARKAFSGNGLESLTTSLDYFAVATRVDKRFLVVCFVWHDPLPDMKCEGSVCKKKARLGSFS